jgi:hypothetical protein
VIRRETQTPTFWHNYQVSESDLEHITNRFILTEQPQTVEELALAVMEHRCAREDELIKRELAKGKLYQPDKSFQVGDSLVFPAFNYAVAEVVAVRPGNNPEYGDFRVAKVAFEDQKDEREFAIELQAPHRLGHTSEIVTEDGLLSPEELYALHGAPVRETLEAYMQDSEEFIRLAGKWFLKSLLIDIDIGQLNLAEALLDMSNGGPLPPQRFLEDLELPSEIDERLQIFSLNYAMSQDSRFDEVGPAGKILWFLRAREPEPVREPPQRLKPTMVTYDQTALDSSLVLLARELSDEWSTFSYPAAEGIDRVTLTLTYPHRRLGTLPLTSQLKEVFPFGQTERIRFTFRDSTTGDTWPGWVVQQQRFVFGLDAWYEENELPAGAFIEVKQGDAPGIVEIDYRRRRPISEWVRVAVPREGRLTFEMRKQSVGCDYDELMIITASDRAELDRQAKQAEERSYPVTQVLYDVFPELAKLNPQGTVHAKTLYAAVNVIRRLPPGPIFAVLMQDMSLLPVGDNYWLFAKK